MTKKISAGNTCVLSKDSTDNPKLKAKKLAGGRLSLFLEYSLGTEKGNDPKTGKSTFSTKRQKVFLNRYLYENPRTPEEREHNRSTLEVAKRIRNEKEEDFKHRRTGYRIDNKDGIDFLEYFRDYIGNYTKKDLKNVKIAYNRFTDFLKDTPRYSAYSERISPKKIDKDMMTLFVEYLQKRSVGEGAHSIYARFKKVVKYATEHDVFAKNPCTGISIKIDTNTLTKAFLSVEEIKTLASTPFVGNQEIKKAFLFCIYTGLRWCDVKELTFSNVDFANRMLSFTQKKTEGHSSAANVAIPLTDSTTALIGGKGKQDAKVFGLPSYERSCRSLKSWVKSAGIEKNISWHCARHTFAVTILSNGADIETAKSLLGHSSITMTAKYLHAVDSLKRRAVESLPELNL